MQQISPELVLVDPALAAAARLMLPEPADCLAPRPRLEELARLPDRVFLGVARRQAGERPLPAARRRWPSVGGAGIAWAILAAIIGSSLLAFIPPSRSARPILLGSEHDVGPPPTGNVEPSDSRPSPGVATIRWSSSPPAIGYSVVLVQGTKRYSFWSARNELGFAERPHGLTVKVLSAGTYRWSVYPILRPQGRISFGQVIGSGVIRIPSVARA